MSPPRGGAAAARGPLAARRPLAQRWARRAPFAAVRYPSRSARRCQPMVAPPPSRPPWRAPCGAVQPDRRTVTPLPDAPSASPPGPFGARRRPCVRPPWPLWPPWPPWTPATQPARHPPARAAGC
eukprot:scaffold5649_cov26-Tisochrysis_lutea.AAC.1